MPDLDIESLLAPLPGGQACGANLEYDPAFQALEEAAAGKPERQYDKVYPAEPPDWPDVQRRALELAARTRDLRVAVWLVRSGARVDGFASAVQGLRLLQGLVERHWAEVHPMIDASDGNDPTARINALYALVHEQGLADLRAAALAPGRGAITVREIELAFGNAEPRPGESLPTREGLTPAVAASQAQVPRLAEAMADGAALVRDIGQRFEAALGAQQSPDLAPLQKLLDGVALAGLAGQGGALAVRDGASPALLAMPIRAAGSIESREDAIRTLQRVCDWLERNEPSHPAPLLIQRAQRLMKKNFLEIIRDLVPDGLGQIEKLAGPGRE
jgi:type VI secretion system protein ImpA